jgi:hypothetical protein
MTKRNRSWTLLLLLGAACSSDTAKAAFTRRVAERVKTTAAGAEVVVVAPLQITVTPAGGKTTTLDLTSLWQSCGEKVDCGAPVDQYAGSVVGPSLVVEAPVKREYLRPSLGVRSNLRPVDSVFQPFVKDLVSTCVLDSPQANRALVSGDLAALGLDAAQAHAAALANLEAAFPAISAEAVSDAPGVFVLTMKDAAGALLLVSRFEPLKAQVKGELIALPVHRDFVYFTGSEEGKVARDKARSLASDHIDGARALGPEWIKWTPAGWVSFPG